MPSQVLIKCGFSWRCSQCDHCKEDFRGAECLGEHVVLLIKGICSSVMFVETLEKKNQYLGGHLVLFVSGVYLNVIYVRRTSEEGSTWVSMWWYS